MKGSDIQKIRGAVYVGILKEHRSVDPLHHTPRVGFRKVGIALEHGQGLVAEHLGNLQETCPIHGEVGSERVAQVVEAEVSDVCPLDGILPRLTDAYRSLAGSVREDKHGINTA